MSDSLDIQMRSWANYVRPVSVALPNDYLFLDGPDGPLDWDNHDGTFANRREHRAEAFRQRAAQSRPSDSE